MSRSSTATGNATPSGGQPPLWTILSEQNNQHSLNVNGKTLTGVSSTGIDRMSICSSHGSSGGYGSSGGSEYSVPRMTTANLTQSTCPDSSYEIIPSTGVQFCRSNNHLSCHNCPQQHHSHHNTNKNMNKANSKPPMPLPIVNPLHSHHLQTQQHQKHPLNLITTQPTTHVGPYENYDIPKTSLKVDSSGKTKATADASAMMITENYDTPKNIQEYLLEDMNSNSQSDGADKYGNYDTPSQMCGCLVGQSKELHIVDDVECPSNNSTLKANK